MGSRALLIVMMSCAALASSARADDSEGRSKKPVDVSTCVKVRTEAIYIPYGYDHIVHVTNGCDKAVRCEVTTSSNPNATTVTLSAGEEKDLVMFKGSPASEVTAQVACKPAAP